MPFVTGSSKAPADARIKVYRFVKYVVVLLTGVLIVKFALFDTVAIQTDQMFPTLVHGDRVVLLRTPFIWPFSRLISQGHGIPVVMKHPLFGQKLACLRVAGLPGDSFLISKAMFKIGATIVQGFSESVPAAEVLLPEFSPRDSMSAYCLPRPGDTIDLDSLSLRDFFFAAAMIKQEQSGKKISMKVDCFIDGKSVNNVPMTNFALFKGPIDSIPGNYIYNWFFWDRLHTYWERAAEGKNCRLQFELFQNTTRIAKYKIRGSFIFLLADDWRTGFDSRYFGPVSTRSIKGKVVCVLWSIDCGKGIINALRTNRIIKIVK
jgi:hypothetical protein